MWFKVILLYTNNGQTPGFITYVCSVKVKPYTGKVETLYRQGINLMQARDKVHIGKGYTLYKQG